jgi:serine O-acetyltransferase
VPRLLTDAPSRSARTAFGADLLAHGVAGAGPLRICWLLASRPGLLAQFLLRLQMGLHRGPAGRRAAYLVRGLNHALTGADFSPGCEVGPGLRIEHPSGIVVGAGAVVGRDAFLCHRVTLGERLGDGRPPAYPVLGDGVFVGTGATVLGAVTVGHRACIGAAAVVLHDVPPGATVVGSPARVVRNRPAGLSVGHQRTGTRTEL